MVRNTMAVNTGFLRNAIVLGLLSAVGPFAIDMYLPAMPAITADLKASPAAVQGTLLSFFVAVALCQVIYGPVSDSFGRKGPLYVGAALYVLGSIACGLAPSIGWLVAARFVQGIGACAGMTIPRAIVRDLHTGHDATRLLSLIMLVFSVSPILAPVTGSIAVEFGTWRDVFWLIAVLGMAALAVAHFLLRETRLPSERIAFDAPAIIRNYLILLSDRHFVGVVLIGGFGFASFLAYIAGASFIYIDHFGLSPSQFSFVFSVNAIAFIGMTQFTGSLVRRYGLPRVVNSALVFFLAVMGTLLVLTLAGVDNVFVLAGCLFLGFGAMGPVIPSTAVLALERYGATAGTASALMGTIQLVVGAVVIGIVGAFSTGRPLPMVLGMFGCAVAAFILGRVTLPRQPQPYPRPVPTLVAEPEPD
jgi:DHA1 family bicyclomycin/chloramphenicol resistance-like MFS transporter